MSKSLFPTGIGDTFCDGRITRKRSSFDLGSFRPFRDSHSAPFAATQVSVTLYARVPLD